MSGKLRLYQCRGGFGARPEPTVTVERALVRVLNRLRFLANSSASRDCTVDLRVAPLPLTATCFRSLGEASTLNRVKSHERGTPGTRFDRESANALVLSARNSVLRGSAIKVPNEAGHGSRSVRFSCGAV